MNIDFMRKVDYWVGVPLTTLLTPWVKLTDRLGKRPTAAQAKRVLFIELSEMGSAILVDPALKRVAKNHEIFFVIFKKNAVSLKIFGTVQEERIFKIRDDSFFALVWDTLKFFAWCRKNQIEAIVDLELFSRFTAILSALSGAPLRLGYFLPRSEGLYRGGLLTHPVAYNPHIHIAKNFIALTEPLAHPQDVWDPLIRREITDAEIKLPQVTPPLEAQEHVFQILRKRIPSLTKEQRLVLVNVNAGDFLPQRKWPKAHFENFVRLLLQDLPDVLVLLTGSPKERPDVDVVCTSVKSDRCINIAGDLKFEDLVALYALSQILITNDSGPGHFASAVGLRTIVLFGPETPALYGPLGNTISIYAGLACSPCVYATNHRNTPCTDNKCLQVISPRFVANQVLQFLKQPMPTLVSSELPASRSHRIVGLLEAH
jgi:ADP-heptose:LPS heptosyltransferase